MVGNHLGEVAGHPRLFQDKKQKIAEACVRQLEERRFDRLGGQGQGEGRQEEEKGWRQIGKDSASAPISMMHDPPAIIIGTNLTLLDGDPCMFLARRRQCVTL